MCKVSELPREGEAAEFEVASGAGRRMICVANVNGECSAMDNVCVHRGGPLGQGMVEGGKLVCPWHGWAFDPKTGAASHNVTAKVQVYPIRVDADVVKIEL